MGVQLTIRDVPESVRDELATRAALQGKSMQTYLRDELEKLASHQSASTWLAAVRARKELFPRQVKVSRILKARAADRR